MRAKSLAIALLTLCVATTSANSNSAQRHRRHRHRINRTKPSPWVGTKLRVMTFNTWIIGKNVQNGQEKIARHIRLLDPDIVGIQEVTDQDALAQVMLFLGAPWKAAHTGNCAIITKHEFANNSFNIVEAGLGAEVVLDAQRTVSFYSMHLAYLSYGPYAAQLRQSTKEMIDIGEKFPRYSRYNNILKLLSNKKFQEHLSLTKNDPLFVVGDFNCPSHLDWVESAKHLHLGWAYEWPATFTLQNRTGLIDSFRELYPDPVRDPEPTWSTINKSYSKSEWNGTIPEVQDRIDFIFYRSSLLKTSRSGRYAGKFVPYPGDVYHNDWPSDHYAFVSEFKGI